MRYKCSVCNGLGHIERWAKKRIENKFIFKLKDLFRTKSCDSCIGTGINFHSMSNSILFKSVW